MLIDMDEANEKVRIALNGSELLEILQDQGEKINPK